VAGKGKVCDFSDMGKPWSGVGWLAACVLASACALSEPLSEPPAALVSEEEPDSAIAPQRDASVDPPAPDRTRR
jgi:hypothetical protein